jgi:hypothetical protein
MSFILLISAEAIPLRANPGKGPEKKGKAADVCPAPERHLNGRSGRQIAFLGRSSGCLLGSSSWLRVFPVFIGVGIGVEKKR